MAKNSDSKPNSGSVLTPELANMMNLPGLRTPDDKYLYKSVVVVTSRPDPGQIGRAPNVLDVAFAWASSVREAITKTEMAYAKGGLGKPQLLEIVNCVPTEIIWSQLMDKDLEEAAALMHGVIVGLGRGGSGGLGGPGSKEN